MKGLFDAFDRNGDGAINLDEFTNGIAVLTTGDFREKVRLAFESFDRNHTGSISKSDLQSYLKSFYVVVRETIQRVTATVSDVFGIDATDSQLFTVSSQHRMSFGKRFSSGMDRHLQDLMRRMADAAFRRAKEGYEGGGNLSLTDFERWAEDQPTLIQWYEHLGEQWLSSIHAKSKSSSVFSNRASRQSLLRRAFQEMDLRSLVRDLQRRGTAWEQISKRDFEDIFRSHVGLPTGVPSVAILGKLFSAFDVENAGRIDVREAVAGLCLLGIGVRGHSERNSMHMLFDMFDRDKSVSQL
jgi:Ca2+-binding EF-hand superfamily protein